MASPKRMAPEEMEVPKKGTQLKTKRNNYNLTHDPIKVQLSRLSVLSNNGAPAPSKREAGSLL